jgi:hypothetical protein
MANNNERVRIWKEAIVIYFKALEQHARGETKKEEDEKTLQVNYF